MTVRGRDVEASSNRDSERDCLERIRAGDEQAFAHLLSREWSGLVGYLQAWTDAELAQDAAQEAFVRFWQQRKQWRSGSARAILYRLARNVGLDLLRRSQARRRWSDVASRLARVEPETPEARLESAELRRRLQAAVEALPKRRRAVFELVRFGGLSYREVSEALEISPQTVANHMSLAQRDLRHLLNDLEPDGLAPSGSESGGPRAAGEDG